MRIPKLKLQHFGPPIFAAGILTSLVGLIVLGCASSEPSKAQAEPPKRHVGVILTDVKFRDAAGTVLYTRDREANLCAMIVVVGWNQGGVSTTLFDCKLLDPK